MRDSIDSRSDTTGTVPLTPEDLKERIKSLWGSATPEKLAATLSLPLHNLLKLAISLKLLTWKDQEAELATLWHAMVPTEEIAARLGRNEVAVLVHANRSKLPRRTPPGPRGALRASTAPQLFKLNDPTLIPCLRCLQPFMPTHKGNRICSRPTCRAVD